MPESNTLSGWTEILEQSTTPRSMAHALRSLSDEALQEHMHRMTLIGNYVFTALQVLTESAPHLMGYVQETLPDPEESFRITFEEGLVPLVQELDPTLAVTVGTLVREAREQMDLIMDMDELRSEDRKEAHVVLMLGLQRRYREIIASGSEWIRQRHINEIQRYMWARGAVAAATKIIQDPVLSADPSIGANLTREIPIDFAA